ncbi:lipase family protein [Gordonia sp. CPCC 205333]|uniref:lipase family protein n=1 Tax=Gordonia sp. CPCC 205333 TaxID=3140790 RepID=UPI003AF34DFD
MPLSHSRTAHRHIFVSILIVLITCAAVSFEPPPAAAEPTSPHDRFYDRPTGLDAAAPGAILRARKVNVRALQLLPVNVDAWQLLYRTTGMDGEPDATVTTVMVPRGGAGRKLLSYQAATDSTLRICNPSFSLINGAPIDFTSPAGPLTFGLPAAELLLAAAGLERGWTVSIPDHGGLDARFLTPRQPGWAVLDGIRAVQSFGKSGVERTDPVGLWGYSGGAIATSWAVEEQSTYAPEINIAGAAMGAPERDLVGSLKKVNGAAIAGLVPMALSAIGKDSPEFRGEVAKYLQPGSRRIVDEIRNHCVGQNGLVNLWFDYRLHLNKPVDVVLGNDIVRRELMARGISGRIPVAPTYIYNGVSDEVAPISGTDKLARSYCTGGAVVTYRREVLPPNPVPQVMSTHGTVAVTGAPGAFAWLKQHLDGSRPIDSRCDWRTVPTTLATGEALDVLGPSFIVNPLRTLLGQPLGTQ